MSKEALEGDVSWSREFNTGGQALCLLADMPALSPEDWQPQEATATNGSPG